MMALTHEIPSLPAGRRNPFWLLPLGAVVGCAVFMAAPGDGPTLQEAFIGAMWGAFGAVPLVIVAAFVLLGLRQRRERAAWRSYGMDWYCSQFPGHARDDVSCRFCGAARVVPRNLTGRGDARAWLCGPCGETLYYSRDSG
jgi:hypothetical protein